jgi:mRNA interferase RelE/StbE
MRRLRIPNEVARLIGGLHPELKRRVRSALGEIVDDPAVGKPLREELAGLHSFRVGRFRIIYRITEAAIEVVAVGPRSSIYQETWRRVRR